MRPPTIPALLVMAATNLAFVALAAIAIIAFIRWFELPEPAEYRLLVDGVSVPRPSKPRAAAMPPQGLFVCTEKVGPKHSRPWISYREIS